MKIDCDIIRDLLPLYAEDMLSDKSRQLVAEHLLECENCKTLYAQMKEPDIQINHNIDPIKKLRHDFLKHTITVAAISAFVTIAAIILIWGLFLLQPGDEMGYALLGLYLILPITALICSCIIGSRQTIVKWFLPVIFGGIGWILPFVVFNHTELLFAALAFIPSALGVILGLIIRTIKSKQNNNL